MTPLAGFRLALHTEHCNYGLNIITGRRPERNPMTHLLVLQETPVYHECGWSSPYGAAHTLQGLTAAPRALIGICGGRVEAHLLCCPINRAANSLCELVARNAWAHLHQTMDSLLFLHGGKQTLLQVNIKAHELQYQLQSNSRNKHSGNNHKRTD